MLIEKHMIIDFAQRGLCQQVFVVQGDCLSRSITFSLYENGRPWELPSGVTPALRYGKSDGTGGVYDTLPDGSAAWTAAGNEVGMLLAPQVMSVPGLVQCQLMLVKEDAILGSFSFHLIVEPDPAYDTVESKGYFNWSKVVGNLIMAPQAEVGQSIRVKAVDAQGNPTEWEAVDLPDSTLTVELVDDTYASHGADDIREYYEKGWNVQLRVDDDCFVNLQRITLEQAVFVETKNNWSGEEEALIVNEYTIVTGKYWDKTSRVCNLNSAQNANGLTSAAKNALLNCFAHVAWTDENGQSYYDALATALNSSGGGSGDDDSGDEGGTTVVTLTSISAVYSGGDVASGTALTDLTDIVVTAHYSDGSTKTIAGYELSGEITTGTNIITVSYGGLTTTFEVVGTTSTRTYLEFGASASKLKNTATAYSDDGETAATIGTEYAWVVNQTFDEDINVHFKITWGETTVWRNLYLASIVPTTPNSSNQYTDIATVYRMKSLADYYVEGDGTTYTYAGNVYEGIYTLKAGCVFALGNINNVTASWYDVDNTYFYVEG